MILPQTIVGVECIIVLLDADVPIYILIKDSNKPVYGFFGQLETHFFDLPLKFCNFNLQLIILVDFTKKGLRRHLKLFLQDIPEFFERILLHGGVVVSLLPRLYPAPLLQSLLLYFVQTIQPELHLIPLLLPLSRPLAHRHPSRL